VAAILEGTDQPPFTVGLVAPGESSVQAVASPCPAVLGVDRIDAASLDDVPYQKSIYLTLGDHLMHFTIDIVIGCTDGPSLTCP
jgi:hypothetical protein